MQEDKPLTSSLESALRKRNTHLEHWTLTSCWLSQVHTEGKTLFCACLRRWVLHVHEQHVGRESFVVQSWGSRQLEWTTSWQWVVMRSCMAVALFSVCHRAYPTSSALRFSSVDGPPSEELDLMILAGVCSKRCVNYLSFPRCYELDSYSS